MIDQVDRQILEAAIRYFRVNPTLDPKTDLVGEKVAGLSDQERFDLAVASYLAEEASLSRVAELVAIPWVELRQRFQSLGLPRWAAPEDDEGVLEDLERARAAG
jgi:hypothetical protein